MAKKSKNSVISTISTIFSSIIYSIIGVLLVGFLYNLAISHVEKQNLITSGELIDVGDYKLQVLCIGESAAKVKVWFVPGSSLPMLGYSRLIEKIGSESGVQACTYQRPGRGFSEGKLNVSNIQVLFDDFENLLHAKKGTDTKTILVGHNIGGAIITVYALENPEEVDGIVLLDPFPIFHDETNEETNEMVQSILDYLSRLIQAGHLASTVGAMRVAALLKADDLYLEYIPDRFREEFIHYVNQPSNHIDDEIQLTSTLGRYVGNVTKMKGKKIEVPSLWVRCEKFLSLSFASDLDVFWSKIWKEDHLFSDVYSNLEKVVLQDPRIGHLFPITHSDETLGFVKKIIQKISGSEQS